MTEEYTDDEIRANRKLWEDAIKSGNYKKGRGLLRDISDNYCCLGIACELFDNGSARFNERTLRWHYGRGNHSALATRKTIKALGLLSNLGGSGSGGKSLSTINDESDTFDPVLEAIKTGNYYSPLGQS